jgi:hypothetical protein
MAAIMALILLPTVAAIGFMFLADFGSSPVATVAGLVFAALALGVFGSLFKLARQWENESVS